MLPGDLLQSFESEALLGEFETSLAAWLERMHDNLVTLLEDFSDACALV